MSAARHRSPARAGLVLSMVTMLIVGATAQSAAATPGPTSPAAKAASAEASPGLKSGSAAGVSAAHAATGFLFVKTADQVVCQTVHTGGFEARFYTRGDCIRVDFSVTNTPASAASTQVEARFIGPSGGAPFKTVAAARRTGDDAWRVVVDTDTTGQLTWPAGLITMRVAVVGDGPAGDGDFFLNGLGATVQPAPPPGAAYAPGQSIPLTGQIDELNDVGGNTTHTGVPASFKIRATDPDGHTLWTSSPLTADSGGAFPAVSIPGSATSALSAGPATEFRLTIGLAVIDAQYTDPVSAAWGANPAGTGAVTLRSAPATLLLDNNFTSSTGWVKPGDAYPFTVTVLNYTDQTKSNLVIDIPAPDGTTFTSVKTLGGGGSAGIVGGAVHWTRPTLGAATSAGARVAKIVVTAKADNRTQDPEIVWKDLSSIATLTYTGGPGAGLKSESHGPKVIPPSDAYDTARYGNKPFPMVPVDFTDRSHAVSHSGDDLNRVVNSHTFPGSTWNLYQEMSYGQLHPIGDVPSTGIASAGFDYAPGFSFSQREVASDCRGTTFGDTPTLIGSPLYSERIHDGWYQLPGDTEYYGGDFPAFTAGPGSSHDEACGPVAKAVYDAAQIADPDIDYNQFDSDKDGLVDFFMMVFVGLGGNGDSQLNGTPPYDNIWPHSYSLTEQYHDAVTGLTGYITDDQLTDLEGTPQCWVGSGYDNHDACQADGGTGNDSKPVYVRVGRYNVNPESAMDHASVIAHEFGHYQGLPDFYSNDYSAYNDLNLMAGDYSQHMTVFSKQDLGWVVPQFLQPNQTVNVSGWNEIKNDTGRIRWQRPDGTFYTLSAANGNQNIHNGQVYGVKLPPRLLIDPAVVAAGASAPDLLFSGRGDNFGCPPSGGHNFDLKLPELAGLAAGAPATLTFKSSFDEEWDFDYGFVMITTDGKNYTSLPSENGTTTATDNPNGTSCQAKYGNGITGQSGAYAGGPAVVAAARAPDSPTAYGNGAPFIADQFDLSDYSGQSNVVLRFSVSTDPGVDRPGWFIDDVKVASGATTLFQTNFSNENALREFSGGCSAQGQTAVTCTAGWDRIKADSPSAKDHAYYIELRDRSGFDFNSRGQSDRGNIGWSPGVFIETTDEVRGYGNVGGGQPPRQHYIDSQPQPGFDCGDNLYEENPPDVLTNPRCQDAAFTADAGDSHFDDNPAGGDWIDNFSDASSADGFWHFNYNCLTLDVTSMSGAAGNSVALPSDLTANATIQAGPGCAPFVYSGATPNLPPVAVAQARPTIAAPNQVVRFDGSQSTDDRQAPSELTYQWDFTNNGSFDATGQTTQHAYPTAGTYTARLRVTDANNASTDTTIVIKVRQLPDLRITKIRTQNVTVNGKHMVKVIATVKNVGLVRARASKTAFRITDPSVPDLGLVDTRALNPGESVVLSKLWNAKPYPGRQIIKIYADNTQKIFELDEANQRRLTVTIQNGWVTS